MFQATAFKMKSMDVHLERLASHKLVLVKLPPGLDFPSCARTKSVEGVLSSARTSPLKGVRKEKPDFGELPVPAHKKRCVSSGECVPLYPEVCSPDQNIKLKSSGSNMDKKVSFSLKSAVMDSNVSSTFHEAYFGESSEVVDVDTTRHLRSQGLR